MADEQVPYPYPQPIDWNELEAEQTYTPTFMHRVHNFLYRTRIKKFWWKYILRLPSYSVLTSGLEKYAVTTYTRADVDRFKALYQVDTL